MGHPWSRTSLPPLSPRTYPYHEKLGSEAVSTVSLGSKASVSEAVSAVSLGSEASRRSCMPMGNHVDQPSQGDTFSGGTVGKGGSMLGIPFQPCPEPTMRV